MDHRGDHGGAVAIIGVACRFPGAADPAEFHDLTVACRRMFRPVAGWPGGLRHAALLDDWTARPTSFDDHQAVAVDPGPVQKLAAETTALAGPGLTHSALLAASLAGLRTLDALGVTPGTAVGYSLGEIAGLVWAGSLPEAEAARLVAQCGQVLRGCGCGPAAIARAAADAETAAALAAPDQLHIAAYEGPRAHVLAGSTAGIRNLTRRAAAAGVAVEVLGITHAMHSPAMARCAAPFAALFAVGAITDLTPFTAAPGAGGTLPSGVVPRMRDAEPAWLPGEGADHDTGPRTTARSG